MREADTAGLAYWCMLFDSGSGDHAAMLPDFTEPLEAWNRFAANLENYLLYSAILKRLRADTGTAYWSVYLGELVNALVDEVLAGLEFNTNYGRRATVLLTSELRKVESESGVNTYFVNHQEIFLICILRND